MCGIAGILNYHPVDDRTCELALKRMLDSMRHRGPDDRGEEKLFSPKGSSLYLGHQRLSIIDLSPLGRQPMSDRDGTLWISTNSEIYNYKELREELKHKYPFRSRSDTEALLAAYKEWGAGCLERLRGMFAFAIWDAKRQVLFLARDRLGMKPLYYYSSKSCFVFASEIRAIRDSRIPKPGIDPAGLYSYLSFGRLQSPTTILSPIRELKPSRFLLVYPENGRIEEKEYWNPIDHIPSRPVVDGIHEKIRESLTEAVRLRMVSDVPVGTFLSGGIDSSVVSVLSSYLAEKPINTLSIVFREQEFDESKYSGLIARELNSNHKNLQLDESDLLAALPQAIGAMDQPTVDGINTYLISRCARESGLKVVLSGVGGDELFAGYDSFRVLPKLLRWEKALRALPHRFQTLAGNWIENCLPRSDKNNKLAHLFRNQTQGGHVYFLFRALFCQKTIERLLVDRDMAFSGLQKNIEEAGELLNRIKPLGLVEQISYLELTHYLANMLLRDTDMMSMAHGLEVRAPLIDHKLVELMFSIPGHLKISPDKPKPLLVDSLPRKLPDEVVFRKKMGFTLPFETWMRTRLKNEMESVLLEPVAPLKGILSEAAVGEVWRDFLDRKVSWSRPWSLYVLKKWVERNVG